MASIAYITDRNMIEFHRLNGNRTMNFWRPSNSKKFTDFKPGDLLFFLAKGSERGRHREKGIVGYGRFQKAHTLSFRQMWNVYGTENGYASEDELYDAIVNKEAIVKFSIGTKKATDTYTALYSDGLPLKKDNALV